MLKAKFKEFIHGLYFPAHRSELNSLCENQF